MFRFTNLDREGAPTRLEVAREEPNRFVQHSTGVASDDPWAVPRRDDSEDWMPESS